MPGLASLYAPSPGDRPWAHAIRHWGLSTLRA